MTRAEEACKGEDGRRTSWAGNRDGDGRRRRSVLFKGVDV
jgi:hypothetical protein